MEIAERQQDGQTERVFDQVQRERHEDERRAKQAGEEQEHFYY
jgi:hypothetical protein